MDESEAAFLMPNKIAGVAMYSQTMVIPKMNLYCLLRTVRHFQCRSCHNNTQKDSLRKLVLLPYMQHDKGNKQHV